MYPDQVKKLDIVCKAASHQQGRPVSHTELIVSLVEERYKALPPKKRREFGGARAPSA